MATRYGTYTTKQIIVVRLNCSVPDPELFGMDTKPRIPRIMTSDPASDPTLDIFLVYVSGLERPFSGFRRFSMLISNFAQLWHKKENDPDP